MNFLDKIKNSPHYDRLKNSAQYKYDRRQFLIIGGCLCVPCLVMMWALAAMAETENPAIVLAFIYILFLLGMIGYFAYRWLEIFLYMDGYIFCQARLDQPHVSGRGGVSFTVNLTDRQGNPIQRETSKMFSSQWEPFLEEYNNKTVLVAYNEKTDRLVVIGLAQGNIH